MPDLVITPANVLASGNAKLRRGVAGATITAGQTLYEDPTDNNRLKLADADGSATTANVAGVALHGAAAGQPITFTDEDDDFTPSATMTPGGIYVLSGTAGGIAPVADLASGDFTSVLMVAKSATRAILRTINSGVQVPE